MTDWLTEAAPAKINLSLHVTGLAPNGYHLLDSLVVFGPVADTVRARAADQLSLTLEGPFADGLGVADNLVLRAATALGAWAGIAPGATLRLEKHLPVASGIGGGSADAAATLRLLVRLWDLHPDPAAMLRLASGLGADVAVCLASRPACMSGIGEILAPAPTLPPGGLLLVNPGVAVATADVFRARAGGFSAPARWPLGWTSLDAMAADLDATHNDLEPPALALCPVIGDVLAALRSRPDCRLARMSGSGATCFGLFDTEAAAHMAVDAMPPWWWCSAGPLQRPRVSETRVSGTG